MAFVWHTKFISFVARFAIQKKSLILEIFEIEKLDFVLIGTSKLEVLIQVNSQLENLYRPKVVLIHIYIFFKMQVYYTFIPGIPKVILR